MRALISLLFLLLLLSVSCSKEDVRTVANRPVVVQTPAGLRFDEEYFWAQDWQKTARGQELIVTSGRLTQAAIDKGVDVSVAIHTEMTLFTWLPTIITLTDNIELLYKVEPGKLYVIARTSTLLNFQSDVCIRYL
jgi:hypothetical protein